MKHGRILAPILFVLLAGAGTIWLVHVAPRGGPAENPQLVEASDAPAEVTSPRTESTAMDTVPSSAPVAAGPPPAGANHGTGRAGDAAYDDQPSLPRLR